LIGADTLAEPLPAAIDATDARQRLAWHDARRGGFERLWPSRAALDVLAGAHLSAMDTALLEDELATSDGGFIANGVESIACGTHTVLFDARTRAVSLLDAAEADAWQRKSGVNWLQEGWLVAPGLADPIGDGDSLSPRTRRRWNRERVYSVHGLRVAIGCATTQQEEAISRALAWHDADHADDLDAVLHLSRRDSLADVIARIDRLALKKAGMLVRRRLRITESGGRHVLHSASAGSELDASAVAMQLPVMIGGSPFGVWRSHAGASMDADGTLQHLDIVSIVASGSSAGDALLDLVSAGPDVVRALDADGLRRMVSWLSSMPIVAAQS
jgi:hypothetical protein